MNGRLVAKPNAMVDTPAMSIKISAVACLSESSPLTNSEASAAGVGKGRRGRVRVGPWCLAFLLAPPNIST